MNSTPIPNIAPWLAVSAAQKAMFEQAIAAGATLVARVSEAHGWRTGRATDPFGHDWEISKQLSSE